jgi:hypothetical protein
VVHFLRLLLVYKSGGMGLTDPHMLRHSADLGCWTSLLTHEGAERWKRSFPALANICSDPILGPSAPTPTDGSAEPHPLPAELPDLRQLRGEVNVPSGAPLLARAPAGSRGPSPRRARKGPARRQQQQRRPQPALKAWSASSSPRGASNPTPISFKDLESVDGPRGTKAGQHALSAHSQRHTSSLIRKSLLDRTSNNPQAVDAKVVLPLVRTHASIIAGSAPNAAMTLTGIPSAQGPP